MRAVLLLLGLGILVAALLLGALVGRVLSSATQNRRLRSLVGLVVFGATLAALASLSIPGSWPANGGRSLLVIGRPAGFAVGVAIGLAVVMGGAATSCRRRIGPGSTGKSMSAPKAG